MGEAVAVVLGADQLGDQIVGQCVASMSDHVVDVGVERIPGAQHDGRVVGGVPEEDLDDVVGPLGEQLPVLAGCTEQRADDRDRVLRRDVGDDVAGAGRRERVHQFIDDVDDDGAQPCGRSRGEHSGHESAQPLVFGAVQTDQALGGPVPQWSRGDALCREGEPLGHAKSGVAQHLVHQFVGEHLGSVRTQRDRRPPAYLADDLVRLCGTARVQIADRRQAGVKHTRRKDAFDFDSHENLLGAYQGKFTPLPSSGLE